MSLLKMLVRSSVAISLMMFSFASQSKADETSDYLTSCTASTGEFEACKRHSGSKLFGTCSVQAATHLGRVDAIRFCDSEFLTRAYINCGISIRTTYKTDLNKRYCEAYAEFPEATSCYKSLAIIRGTIDALSECAKIMAEVVKSKRPNLDLTAINNAIQLPENSLLLIQNEIEIPMRGCGYINEKFKSNICQICRSVESRNAITLVHDQIDKRAMVVSSIRMENEGKDLIIGIENDEDNINQVRCRSKDKALPIANQNELAAVLLDNGITLTLPPSIRVAPRSRQVPGQDAVTP